MNLATKWKGRIITVKISDNLFEKVFAEFKKLTPALLALCIASGLILFLPEAIFQKLALNGLPLFWKRTIGILFVVCLALIATISLDGIYKPLHNRIAKERTSKKLKEKFLALSPDHKQILLEALTSENRSIQLCPTSGDATYLQNGHFLHRAQSYIFAGPGYIAPVAYVPEPWLIDLYNREPELFV